MNRVNSRPVMLASLTVEEFVGLMKKHIPEPPITENPKKEEKKYVYGLQGLADLLDVSYQTAYRIKKTKKLDKAIKQIGRKIIIDAEMALELLDSPGQS